METIEVIGLVAAAIVAVGGAAKVIVSAFVKAVEAAVGPRFDELERRMSESDRNHDEELDDEMSWVKVRLDQLSSSVSYLESELQPNHGSSLRDAVDRLERMMLDHIDAA